jgi:hypothetical protein
MNSPIPWEVLARLQSQSDPRTTHARSLGREEAFEGVLDDLLNHRILAEAEQIERRFNNLCANRATKYRRRACLLRRWRVGQRHDGPDPSERLLTQDLIEHVRRAISANDYRYLLQLAEGRSYAQVATWHSMREGNLRSRVCRARACARSALTET